MKRRFTVANPRDLMAGLALLIVAAGFGLGALNYPRGTASHMGPGYFPLVISLALGALAVLTVASSFVRPGALPGMPLRPFLAVIGSIGVFALTIERLGLMPAVFLVVVTLALADQSAGRLGMALLALGLSLCAWLIFSLGLGLPLPAFQDFS